MSGIRISPSGTYILLLLKGAPCELWTTAPKDNLAPVSLAAAAAGAAAVASADSCAAAAASPAVHDMGGEAKPWRVRLLDLPFSAVEWVAADDGPSKVLPADKQCLAAACFYAMLLALHTNNHLPCETMLALSHVGQCQTQCQCNLSV